MSSTMVTADAPTLKDRQYADTRRLILQSAVEQIEAGEVHDLTMRGIAKRAGIAERTMFRHFETRDELLDALSVEVALRLELPSLPESAAELVTAPNALYRSYEAHASLTRAALHSELFDRIRLSVAAERWAAIRSLVDRFAPECGERERMLTAANIRHLLSATTWHYYRFYFRFSLKDSIGAAELAIGEFLAALQRAHDTRRSR